MTAHDLLGVAPDASEADIRAAYVKKVREFPPDRSPTEFESIRDAYASLTDRQGNSKKKLFNTDFTAPLQSLIDSQMSQRNFAGPEAWREVLKIK